MRRVATEMVDKHEGVLDTHDLVDSVAQTGHFLAVFVQPVLRETELDHEVIVVLPFVFKAERLNDFQLFRGPVAHGGRALDS